MKACLNFTSMNVDHRLLWLAMKGTATVYVISVRAQRKNTCRCGYFWRCVFSTRGWGHDPNPIRALTGKRHSLGCGSLDSNFYT